jgi:hypothetical protein
MSLCSEKSNTRDCSTSGVRDCENSGGDEATMGKQGNVGKWRCRGGSLLVYVVAVAAGPASGSRARKQHAGLPTWRRQHGRLHRLKVVSSHPLDPVNLAVDRSDNLPVLCSAGLEGTVYSLKPDGPDGRSPGLRPSPRARIPMPPSPCRRFGGSMASSRISMIRLVTNSRRWRSSTRSPHQATWLARLISH